MNNDARQGLKELSDWVASMRRNGPRDDVVSALAVDAPDVGSPPNGDAANPAAQAGTSTADTNEQPVAPAGSAGAPPSGAMVDLDTSEAGDGDGKVDAEDARPRRTTKKRSPVRALFDWVLVIAIALSVAFVVRTFVLAHFVVDGTSMATTLENGDRVFVNKLSYRFGEPSRGDVVVLHQIEGARDLIKRVIGLPGETVDMRQCQVFIDGRPLDEPYLDPDLVQPGNCGRGIDSEVVPDDHVFVMGDNRAGSQDSRNIGPIPRDELVGRAFVVFWPPGNWRWL